MNLLMTLFFASLSTLATIHITALTFFLYWKYVWLDIPVHVLGGITIILGVSILPFFGVTVPKRYKTLFISCSLVLIGGVMWEVFEAVAGVPTTRTGFVLDTSIDLLMDLLGGALGYGIVKSITTLTHTS